MSPQPGDKIFISDSTGREVNVINNQFSFRYPSTKSVEIGNEGKVVALLEGEGFNKIVAVDHGFGLLSVYSNFKEISVSKNQVVDSNTSIGVPGNLPQIQDGGFDYGMFFQGKPIRAIEWWDKNWINDHLLKKIADVKKILGVTIPLPELPPEDILSEPPRPIIRNLDDISNEYREKLGNSQGVLGNQTNKPIAEERRIRDF